MAKKFFSRKLSLACTADPDPDPLPPIVLNQPRSLVDGPITVQPGRSSVRSDTVGPPSPAPHSESLWGTDPKGHPFVLREIDLSLDHKERRNRILSHVAQEKLKRSSYDASEIVIEWFHRDITQVKRSSKGSNSTAITQSKSTLSTHVIDCDSFSELSGTEDNYAKPSGSTPVGQKLVLPLVPDFTSYVTDPDIDLASLNLSSLDREQGPNFPQCPSNQVKEA